MNTNWAKILLFSLIGFALGFLVCRTCCGGRGGSERGTSCSSGNSCGHGGERKAACCRNGKGHGHAVAYKGEHPGDAEADAISARLEAAGFMGDTTISIAGGEVHVVRSANNTSVHVDIRDTTHADAHQDH